MMFKIYGLARKEVRQKRKIQVEMLMTLPPPERGIADINNATKTSDYILGWG